MTKKVLVLPCSGIGKSAGEIGRQAAYRVIRCLRPEQTDIVCLARLIIDDAETLELVKNNYVITLDGCQEDCAKKSVERLGKTVDHGLHISDLLDDHPEFQPLGVLTPGAAGMILVDLLADQVAAQLDVLTGKEG